MAHFSTIPSELVAVLGPVASDKLVDFLNSSFSLQREDVIAVSALQFESKLTGEIAGLRLEIADLRTEVRTEIADLRGEMRAEIADLRAEMRTEIARTHTHIEELRSEMKADFASVHKEIAGIHREISAMTKWILVGLVAASVLYPVLSRILIRLIP